MTIWIVFALMTAALVAVLLRPLGRTKAAPSRSAFGQAVFRDQLAELDRDVARGMIGAEEAAAARNEIARRLITAEEEPASRTSAPLRVSWIVVLIIPAIALPLYLQFGSPQLKDVALEARLASAVENNDVAALIRKVERHLAANPGDLEGWKVLATAYKGIGRYGDAARAYENIVRLSTPTADLYGNFAEMLVLANEGTVTGEAARAIDQALKLDGKQPAARFLQGLALKQEGKEAQALAAWKSLLAETPADAPWKITLEREIASLSGVKAPALTQQQIAAAQDMSPADRQSMIRSMVDGLEARLASDGNDIEGWRRLIRARTVLGETDAAKTAYLAAKRHFQDRNDAIASLDSLADELGIR